ncbi:MAG: N-acetyltransferase family protein [Gemmatimonadota bacterium]
MTNDPGPLAVRPATSTDLPDLLSIYNDAILTTTAVFSYQPHTMAMRQEWFAAKRDAGHPVLVAEHDGKVLGFAALGPFRVWPAYKYSLENSVYVAADGRGQGVGGLLLDRLLRAARQLDVHTVIASVEATNTASLRLHTSHGFTEVARFREVGYKFGRWLDLVFLQVLFDSPKSPIEG